jgi:hypothetical protein
MATKKLEGYQILNEEARELHGLIASLLKKQREQKLIGLRLNTVIELLEEASVNLDLLSK